MKEVEASHSTIRIRQLQIAGVVPTTQILNGIPSRAESTDHCHHHFVMRWPKLPGIWAQSDLNGKEGLDQIDGFFSSRP